MQDLSTWASSLSGSSSSSLSSSTILVFSSSLSLYFPVHSNLLIAALPSDAMLSRDSTLAASSTSFLCSSSFSILSWKLIIFSPLSGSLETNFLKKEDGVGLCEMLRYNSLRSTYLLARILFCLSKRSSNSNFCLFPKSSI